MAGGVDFKEKLANENEKSSRFYANTYIMYTVGGEI